MSNDVFVEQEASNNSLQLKLLFCLFYVMSNLRERTFKLLIYESEYRQIQAWTNKYQDQETGGDLFGLWKDDRTAVIQLVVGPGKHCRRTASFSQDVDYLRQMGDASTQEEGLCHIGEWHSHHRLSLSEPSSGDESTVWSNMKRYGLSRFLLLIANISTAWKWLELSSVATDITVNGFLFERRNHRCLPLLQAEFIFLHEESPFRQKYIHAIREGAESLNSAQDQLCIVAKRCRLMELERKKIHQEKQEVEASLAVERDKRREAEKELQKNKKHTCKLQKSIDEQERVREETKKTVNSILLQLQKAGEEAKWYQQRSLELEASLKTERQVRNDLKEALAEEQRAHEETTNKLRNSELTSQELKASLEAQTRVRQQTERRFQNVNDQSQRTYELRELEKSLTEERKEHEQTWRNLCNSQDGLQELQTSLYAHQQAREETERRLHSSQQRSQELETALLAQIQDREETGRRLYYIQQRSSELEASLAAQTQAREETERRLRSGEQRSQELETCIAEQSRSREEAEWRFHEINERFLELEKSLTTERLAKQQLKSSLDEEQKAHEETRRSTPHGWILNRDDVDVSATVIREGDWGRAFKGSFYRHEVVVKEINPQILSGLVSSFIEREMKMTFDCRHPCLLQFFGATYDQNPLFVFELPDTSLSTVIEQKPLEPLEITDIALDVAKGLNYLHAQSPDPIVHGDISSANVFLWKKRDAGWQAKLSDFCTIHLVQQSMADFSFDSMYAAPEAKGSKSPKVDVYSFGILLFEMIVRELPDYSRQEQQRAKLPHHYERLIKWCVWKNPEDRPSMLNIIERIIKKIL